MAFVINCQGLEFHASVDVACVIEIMSPSGPLSNCWSTMLCYSITNTSCTKAKKKSRESFYFSGVVCPDPLPSMQAMQGEIANWRPGPYYVGHQFIFQCKSFHLLRGSSNRTCMSNGQWSGRDTICDDPGECTFGFFVKLSMADFYPTYLKLVMERWTKLFSNFAPWPWLLRFKFPYAVQFLMCVSAWMRGEFSTLHHVV